MKQIMLILMMVPFLVSSQYTSQTTGDWTTGSTWVGGTAPSLTGGNKLSSEIVTGKLKKVPSLKLT